jgi:hypothetical protein
MPERANSLASAFIVSALAAAALLGLNRTAFAAAECLENPDLRITQPGHWYFYSDRTQSRRCWHFQPAEEASANAAAPALPATAANDDSQQSILSRLAAHLSQTFSSPPQQRETQQNSIPDDSGEAAQTIPPRPAKPDKTVRRERPDIAPPPTTTGAATAERREPPQRSAADRNDKRDPPLNVAEREALFQDFMKWQLERNVFGRP